MLGMVSSMVGLLLSMFSEVLQPSFDSGSLGSVAGLQNQQQKPYATTTPSTYIASHSPKNVYKKRLSSTRAKCTTAMCEMKYKPN